ncbi:MAG: hypothetical protein NZ561_06385, partial [Phycisphaerae bacterium]|nr:hypothetical protein [Phycisphaerae bacterium]
GHKRQGDWQAACGVTVRVPHLAWLSMAGEAKRDYPAAIDYHSPWFAEYRLIEDHFARINTVMTRGRPLVKVAVIHPIESFWLSLGPAEQYARQWEQREWEFQELTRWLAFGLIDFDFVSEANLAQAQPATPRRERVPEFQVGAMRYQAVILPNLWTLRSTTVRHLERFVCDGGCVIVAGEPPRLVDARPATLPSSLSMRWMKIPFSKSAILERLEPLREIDVRRHDGTPVDSILHQIRTDGRSRYVFLANTSRDQQVSNATICLRGTWDVTELDTRTGTTRLRQALCEGGNTKFSQTFSAHGHLLLALSPRKRRRMAAVAPEPKWKEIRRLTAPVRVTLSEPNALLLDQAEWRVDDGPWQPREEILRIDNAVRRHFGLSPRGGQIVQPWADTSPAPVLGMLQLRFQIETEVAVGSPMLAMEEAAAATVWLDGRAIRSVISGWWVDESIQTIRLPTLRPGRHELRIRIPFSRKSNVEWCYLLGDFGVLVSGATAVLSTPVRRLQFGDWTRQGLPFYAGNVTYHCELGEPGRLGIEVNRFRNPLLSVELDGKPAGKIAFAPYRLLLGRLAGNHRIAITAYGNRVNAFGPLHHTNDKLSWVGPAAWRSEGTAWSYEYNLKAMGILAAPILYSVE